jgi:Zn-dependent peptidase ImmA (M78 family)/transcriptional regulator with XRE-family HTH domain
MNQDEKTRGFPIARARSSPLLGERFNPAMLITAREARSMSQSSLAEKMGASQALVSKWEQALATPDEKQVDSLSINLDVQRSFFFVDRSRRLASMSDFYHRALAKALRSDLKSIHARCSIIDLQVDRLLDLAVIPKDRIPDHDPDNHAGNVDRIAMMARTAMGVEEGPVKNLVEVIERCGGIVVDHDFHVDEVEALCRWVPELPKLFFINGSKPPDRTRFSLAHELGHTIMHFGRDFDPKLAEDQANAFAAAFLMPAHEIKRDLKWSLALADLASLKRKWRVSMQAIARRAKDLQIIDERRYRSLCVQMSRNGWRKSEPVQISAESPKLYTQMVLAHVEAGYTAEELAKLLFVSEQEVHRILVDAGSPTWERDGVRLRLVQ